MKSVSFRCLAVFALLSVVVSWQIAFSSQLHIGSAETSITPKLPVALIGSFSLRVAKSVKSPVTANVVAIESRDGNKPLDLAIMVSCDLAVVPEDLTEIVREKTSKLLPELDVHKIFLSATHTHAAPCSRIGKYDIPKDVIQQDEYREFFADRVSAAIAKAWKSRKPGSVTWGLGHAVVAYCRRATYADGHAQMYGNTNRPDFRAIEAVEDHAVNCLFFFDDKKKPIVMCIDVACPAQVEGCASAVSADFWHPTRLLLKKKYGQNMCVLGWAGASGDQSPRPLFRRAAEERMRGLRGLTPSEETARRIARAVDDVYEVVKNDLHSDAILIHKVQDVGLPARRITPEEYARIKSQYDQLVKQIKEHPQSSPKNFRRMRWLENVVERYAKQEKDPNWTYPMELHAIRLGNTAIATNSFELFTEFGTRIIARSNAEQTFVIQLVGRASYLPTAHAVRGGHYSAIVESSRVGPKGGQVLVDKTVDLINSMWK